MRHDIYYTLVEVCRRAGIEVRVVNDALTDSAEVVDGRYVITLCGRDANNPEVRHLALAHELAHILRGDLLALQERGYERLRWNIATDAVINESLRGRPAAWVSYEWVRKELSREPLPEWLPSAETIYKALGQSPAGGGGTGLEGASHDALATDGTMTGVKHAETVIAARGALNDPGLGEALPQGLKEALDKALGGGIGRGGRTAVDRLEAEPVPSRELAQVLEAVAGAVRSRKERTRTWTRPGRTDWLRGTTYIPKPRLAVGLDVSGSTGVIRKLLDGLLIWAAQTYEVDAWAWADRAAKIVGRSVPDVGGGTSVQPFFAQVGDADVVVVLTDGLIPDPKPLPEPPVVWVGPKTVSELPVRAGYDRVVVVK